MAGNAEMKDNKIAWFAILLTAERTGDSASFEEAYNELKRLGIIVRFKKDKNEADER